MKGQPLGACPACGKRVWPDRKSAKTAARQLYPGQSKRTYQCPDSEWWHITSQGTRATTSWREYDRSKTDG